MMRATLVAVALLIGTMGAAKAECLQEIGQLREQVDSQNQTRPTAQSQAAARELQKLEWNEQANEMDCYNTLAKARAMFASPIPPTADDRFAKDRRNQP
jgi:hypothetical protein